MFQKILKARGEHLYYGSPATVGRAVEDYVSAVAVDGMGEDDALRHASSVLDEHELVPWDKDADQERLELHKGEVLEAISKNALEGIQKALRQANQILGQRKLTASYSGLALDFLGFADFLGGHRVAELKVKTSTITDHVFKIVQDAGAVSSPYSSDQYLKASLTIAVLAEVT